MSHVIGAVGGLITLGVTVKVIELAASGRNPLWLLLPFLAYLWAQIIFHMYRRGEGHPFRQRNLAFLV